MNSKLDLKNSFLGPIFLPRPNTTNMRLTVDDDILEWFGKQVDRNCGGDYGDLMSHALREYVENHPDGLDDEMRAVLRAPRKVNPKYLAWMERTNRAKPKKPRAR